MTMALELPVDAPAATGGAARADDTVQLHRRTIDRVLIALGMLTAVVLATAGGLLTWGHNFASDYVGRELRSQHIAFPDEASLTKQGRTDLVQYAGQQVVNGDQAEAYASFISGHLDGIAGGKTYADLGTDETAAKQAVTDAKANGATDAEIATLQAKADDITGQRNTLFKGETLRGLLLSTYAWSTIGEIAMIAAVVAFAAAAVMIVLVVLGMVHLRRHRQVPAA